MDEGVFDVVVIGTGLTESITAAALSKAGFKVAHLDRNPYYGADEASLSLDEFIHWTKDSPNGFSLFSRSGNESLPHSRQYSISLSPSVIPSTGPLISSLISSGVSRYGGFRLIDQIGIYSSSGTVQRVPGNKEDIFKNKNISLVDKRRLMRFLMFASGDFEEAKELKGNETMSFIEFLKRSFSLNDEIASTITYALGHCLSASDTTLPTLQRLRRYLRSSGRYGSSPFLVGHYGSSGEIAQGFCRTSAVSGGVYILGKTISSITSNASSDSRNYTIHLDDFPEPFTCDLIISSERHIPDSLTAHAKQVPAKSDTGSPGTSSYPSVARCVAIIDRPLSFHPTQDEGDLSEEEVDPTEEDDALESSASETQTQIPAVDAGVLVFPPSSLSGGSATTFSVTAFIVGDSTMSTPKEKWIIYISTPVSQDNASSPEEILKPYLDATLSLARPQPDSATTPIVPLFTTFYLQSSPVPSSSPSSASPSSNPNPTCLMPPPLPLLPLPESPDSAAVNAESVFWEAVNVLKAIRKARTESQTVSRAGTGDSGADANAKTEDQGQSGEEASGKQEQERETETEKEIESFWPPIEQNDDEEDF
ncbi:hypothetical protein VKT23_019048 [Stygiomarasmius scandens]|uniref:FAD/NAD(P)-binding domain-containing protein n=1 Tax=Marasmiellus scandens TaxID=2682957 RepID=A0ABR1IMJ7_9AGAR